MRKINTLQFRVLVCTPHGRGGPGALAHRVQCMVSAVRHYSARLVIENAFGCVVHGHAWLHSARLVIENTAGCVEQYIG